MLWNSISDHTLAVLNSDRLRNVERQRRHDATKRYLLMKGALGDLVRDELAAVFHDQEQAKRVALTKDSSINVFRYVIEEIYDYQGAKRAFRVGEQRDEVYDRIVSDIVHFDLWMGEAVRWLGACKDILWQVLPGLPREDGTVAPPRMRIFLPHEVTVLEDPEDPARPLEVRYDTLDADGEVATVVWSAAEHYVITPKGFIRPPKGASETRNPYGRLPFFAMHAGLRSDGFWDPEEDQDLVDFALEYLADWASVRYTRHQQSYKLLVRTGTDDKTEPFAHIGPGVELQLAEGEEVETLDMSADPTPSIASLKAQLSQALASRGLNPERLGMNPGQAPPSGLARFLERQELIERRRKIMPAIEEGEYELAELYRWAWNFNRPPAEQIDPDAAFEVELLEETVVMSPTEEIEHRKAQLDVYERERKLGLKSEVEIIAEDRGISVEEALKLVPSLKRKPEILGYHIETGVVTVNDVRASLGLDPDDGEDGKLTIPELRAKYPERFAGAGGGGAQE